MYELLGSPTEFGEDDINQWEGSDGTINVIRKFCSFTSGRARQQIRDVITYVSDAIARGEQDIDAGFKEGAGRSGRKCILSRQDNEIISTTLNAGLGIEMTWEIINQKRTAEGKQTVDESTVRRAAHTFFGGVCHNRPLKKTGSKDRKR